MSQIERIKRAIMSEPQNASYTERGIDASLCSAKDCSHQYHRSGTWSKTQEAGLYWKDKSGDRLRDWLGVDEDTFYNSGYFAVLPMDFYFQGMASLVTCHREQALLKNGIPQLLQELPDIQLTLLIGQYAQAYYLREKAVARNRTGKTLPELLARLFSTSSPFTTKSNLDGQKSLV